MDHEFQIVERRCKICTSSLRDEIDLMLLGESKRPDGRQYRFADIVDWAGDQGLKLSEASLSRHFHNHVQPSIAQSLETQRYMEAVAKATGKKLSLHSALANVIATKALRLLNDSDLSEVDPEKVMRLALMAGRNSMHIEKAEHLLNRETADQVGEKLKREGLSPEIIREIEEQILGLRT